MKYLEILKSIYTLIIVVGIVICYIAKHIIKKQHSIALNYEDDLHTNGFRVANSMLKYYNITDVNITKQDGIFNDRYVPGNKNIILCGVSYLSPSIVGIATALHQACFAIQDNKNHFLFVFKDIISFSLKTLSMLAVISVLFIYFFPTVLKVVLIIYASAVIINILLCIYDYCGIYYAKKYLDEIEKFDTNQKKLINNILTSQTLSYVATIFSPISLILKLVLDRNKDLVEVKRTERRKK